MSKPNVPMNLPSNSHNKKAVAEKPQKNIQKVVTGKVIDKKKGVGAKFAETFLGDTVDSVTDYIVKEVIVPAGLNMASAVVDEFLNIFRGGFDMMLFGEKRSRHNYRNRSSYSTVSSSVKGVISTPGRSTAVSNVNRVAVNHIDDILLDNRGDAELVIDRMQDVLEEYGFVSVSDLYEMVGKTHTFADQKLGWSVLDDAYVKRTRDGLYKIVLPRTRSID